MIVKTKKIRVLGLFLGLMLICALTGCDSGNDPRGDPSDPGNPNNPYNPYGDSGTGWPSSRLSKYGIGGMSQPQGASNIEWWEYEDFTGYEYPVIYISFNAAAAAGTAIQNYFDTNGWAGSAYGGYGSYSKGNASAGFSVAGGFGYIVAGYIQ